ncbi:hypothetical protein [Synechococcus sp. UW140]|uniref:hypothetical protein n=1 Tax=Synechococcus sp. UW140 TaxID=368503 RepID=UPI00352AAB50
MRTAVNIAIRPSALLLLALGTTLGVPLQPALPEASARPVDEMEESAFLDLVDKEGLVLITAIGVEAVDAEARRRRLSLPALGYWSPDGGCFRRPPQDDCNGIFRP